MSTTGDGDPAPGRQEGTAGAAGAQAGAREGVDRNSVPRRGDAMPEAEAGGVAGPSGGLREAAMEGWSAEEDSDIGPAEEEEEEEEEEGGVGRMVDARHFPMSGFRLTFVDLVHSVLNRFYYNNHVLVRPPDGQVPVRRRTRPRLSHHSSAAMAGFPEVQVPSVGPGAGPAEEAQEAEEAEEASLWETAAEESEESSLWEMAQEPAAPAETTECQDENSKAAAQGTKSEGKEKEYNKKQEEPEKDLDPAKDRPRKSSLED
ncbi:cancer/testis antigen 47A-like [Cervus elaphus]|uniref:cancer/testis antigen 47A-like n=1 Tax=Cervus elaphus TaxID=9860 RepID=UPI001CC3037F|nr:cancer/testis antigen 47A-like [Cervus elaphus]